MSDVRLSDYINPTSLMAGTTTNAVTLTLVGGSYDPEQHPDYIAAKNDNEGYSFEGTICRHCGVHSENAGVSRLVKYTDYGYDCGGPYTTRDGTVEWEPDYIESEGEQEDVETVYFRCRECDHETDELDDLVVAYPYNSLEHEEVDSYEDSAFARSIHEGRLIVFDASDAAERREQEEAETARRQLDLDRQALATLQARIAQNERKAA